MPATCNFDVILSILDRVGFEDLLRCSHVSHVWRSASHFHPTYWKRLALTDEEMTPGGVASFLTRLNSRREASATIYISLRCGMIPGTLTGILVRSLGQHLYRVERLNLVVSAYAARQLREVFQLSAPRLQHLCVMIRFHDAELEPLEMFDLHKHKELQKVILLDVPLAATITPIGHRVTSVSASYFELKPQIAQLLSWVPHTQNLSVVSPHRDLDLPLPSYARSFRHLSMLCNNWVSFLRSLARSGLPPSLTVETSMPEPMDAASLLPEGLLCVSIKTHGSRALPTALCGVVAVSTPDRHVGRMFRSVNLAYMISQRFMDVVVPAHRVVMLTISLTSGFINLCSRGYHFPRLEALCLGVGTSPPPPSLWRWGAIGCPLLRTLVLQAEWDGYPPYISAFSIRAFMRNALVRGTASQLRVVLKDVALAGIWVREPNDEIASITQESPRTPWIHDTGLDWMNDTEV